jgi:hypothetical protein
MGLVWRRMSCDGKRWGGVISGLKMCGIVCVMLLRERLVRIRWWYE